MISAGAPPSGARWCFTPQAIQYVVGNHVAQVISQSFASAEDQHFNAAHGSRGRVDIAFQASAATGALVCLSPPPDGNGSNIGNLTTGWYDIGGTSLSCSQRASERAPIGALSLPAHAAPRVMRVTPTTPR